MAHSYRTLLRELAWFLLNGAFIPNITVGTNITVGREIALIKIIYNKVHNSHETQTKKLTTRAHDGPVIDVTKPNSTKYLKSIAYSGPVTWNQLKPDIRCIGDKNNFTRAIKSLYWESYKSMNTS